MITFTGESVWPDWSEDPTRPDIPKAPSLQSIAVGLSRMPRFAGQTQRLYTVLAHTYAVAECVPKHDRLYALLHDAPEAIVGDVPTTWKTEPAKDNENQLLKRISVEMGIQWPWPREAWESVHKADYACLMAEAHELKHSRAEFYWPKADIPRLAIEATRTRLQGIDRYHGVNPSAVDNVQQVYVRAVQSARAIARDHYGV